MTVMDLTHPEDRGITRNVKQRIESGRSGSIDYEKRYLRKDGRVIWVRVTAAPIRLLHEGNAVQYVAVIEDVTARVRADIAPQIGGEFARQFIASVRNQGKVTRNEQAIPQLRSDLARTGTASGS